MNHLKKYGWLYLLIIVIGIAIWYFGFKKGYFAKLFPKRVGEGREPTEDDIYCGGSSRSSERTTEELCTKPLYGSTSTSKERAFLMETDDYPYNKCMATVKDKYGKEWFFNYRSNKRCIFIDDTSNPNFEPLTEEEQKIWNQAFKNAISEVLSSYYLNCCSTYHRTDGRPYMPYDYVIKDKLEAKNDSLTAPFWRRDLINQAKNKHKGYLSRQTLQPQIVCWGCMGTA